MSKDYIIKSSSKVLKERREFQLFGYINVYVKDAFPSDSDINMSMVIKKIEESIPRDFVYGLELIVVGQFEDLNSRGVKAAFMDGAIYVTNEQDSVDDIYDDIVHEISHSVEKTHGSIIFSDGHLINEYIGKKQRLISLLAKDNIILPPDIPELEYSREFDEFMHYELGAEKSMNYCNGLFIETYAAVSLSEYFATGFEAYYVDNQRDYLAKISPVLHEKIEQLTNYVMEEY